MSSNKPKWKEGYVALIDILGFSRGVEKDTVKSFFSEYNQSIERIMSLQEFSSLKYLVFSDTILLYTQDDKKSSFEMIVSACSILFVSLLKIGLPPRGAISYGKYNLQKTANGVILAGKPIIDAYNYEKKQNWIGIMISPELVGKMISNKNLKILEKHPCIEKCPNIPFHQGGSNYKGYVVMPSEKINPSDEEIMEEIRKTIVLLKENVSAAPDIESQIKYKNTLEWLNNYLYKVKGPGGEDSPNLHIFFETEKAKKTNNFWSIPIAVKNISENTADVVIISFEIEDSKLWSDVRFGRAIRRHEDDNFIFQLDLKSLLQHTLYDIDYIDVPIKERKILMKMSITIKAKKMKDHAYATKFYIYKNKIKIDHVKDKYVGYKSNS